MNSRIILAKGIKLDREYNNVLNYTTEQMLTLLRSNSHIINEANNYSFIRNSRNTIFVGFSYNECLQANYIAFQNPDYSNKWFFAWIDEVIFKGSTNGCEITFTIDSWATWFEKVTTKPCFVVREHTNNDTIGANTIEEGLNVGEVIEENYDEITFSMEDETTRDYYYIVMTTFNPAEGSDGDFVGVNRVNKNIFGSKLYAFSGSSVGVSWLRGFIIATNKKSKIESIENIFIAPASLIENIGTTERIGYLGPRNNRRIQIFRNK